MNVELPPFKNGEHNSESTSTIDRVITSLRLVKIIYSSSDSQFIGVSAILKEKKKTVLSDRPQSFDGLLGRKVDHCGSTMRQLECGQ